jgi:myo-inositol catabolism protein IolC
VPGGRKEQIAMAAGDDRHLFLLAFDHRRPHLAKLFGVGDDPTADQIARVVDAKAVVFDGFVRALDDGAPADEAGILVDEQFGAEVARAALARGWICAMPVEASGLRSFAFEYGHDYRSHVEAFEPTFAKVLVRYNVDGRKADNARSVEGLEELSGWLRETGRRFLCELIVPPEPAQLERVGDDVVRYETEMRPGLMRRAIADFQEVGIEPDVWKVEGIDRRDDCEMVAGQARAGGRDGVGCVVLGQGADAERTEHWLRTAAGVPGYLGFAIGRTLWWDPIAAYLDGSLAREEAATQIAARYRRAIAVFTGAG